MVYITEDSFDDAAKTLAAIAGLVEVTRTPRTVSVETVCNGSKVRLSGTVEPRKVAGEARKARGGKAGKIIECDGRTMTTSGWAAELGVTNSCVLDRMKRTGNPYGRKGPTDADKIAAGCPAVQEEKGDEQ